MPSGGIGSSGPTATGVPRAKRLRGGTLIDKLSFLKGGADGESPIYGSLAMDATGNLYGDTLQGGTDGEGTVFKVDTAGNESVLHTFTGGGDGATP